MSEIQKAVLDRFLRSFVAGAVATMVLIIPNNIQDWQDVGMWVNSLIIAGIVGGISGALQSADKYRRII